MITANKGELKNMTINEAFCIRISRLTRHKMSLERLEQESGLSRLVLKNLLDGTVSDVKLSHIVKVARVLKISLSDFFDNELFDLSNLD